jgi:hypothetical protein
MITMLNRIWIQRCFKDLIKATRQTKVANRYPDYGDRVRNALYFLTQAQQAPLRITQVEFWLASLIVSPKNHQWWVNVAEYLRRSRRGVTFSLVAQIALAAFVWLLTIVSSIFAAAGSSTAALQIAAATLWIWIVGRFRCGYCVHHLLILLF